jgi:hypothetical protein
MRILSRWENHHTCKESEAYSRKNYSNNASGAGRKWTLINLIGNLTICNPSNGKKKKPWPILIKKLKVRRRCDVSVCMHHAL